jgi:hypothetical protein
MEDCEVSRRPKIKGMRRCDGDDCLHCYRADKWVTTLNAVFQPQSSDRGSAWRWALLRWRRMMSHILMERRAALLASYQPQLEASGDGCGPLDSARCRGGISRGDDLDGAGGWGRHVRQWEDRADNEWEHQ